jgi:phenylacetate-CoA ligase
MIQNWIEVYYAAEVTRADRIFFAFSFGPFIGFWLAFEAGIKLGALCLAGGGLSSSARLRVLLDQAATVLCCTPTYAIRLAEVASEEGVDLSAAKVRKIIVAGEPGGSIPATRSKIERLWPGARVYDHHGMTEVGPVTYECPAQPGKLHVIEPAYFPEVIDSLGKSVKAGELGELVLTTLGRTGSPLLRYRTGDFVKLVLDSSATNPQPCSCGSYRMGLQGGILGRTDDMVIVRGVNIFPSSIEEIVRSFSEIAEYQVHVKAEEALAELEIKIEPVNGSVDCAALIARLERALMNALSLRVPVTAAPCGGLPRYELKAKRWTKSVRP